MVVIRRTLASAAGCLALIAGAACTTAPSAPRAAPTPTPSRAAPHRVSVPGRHRSIGNAAGGITLAFAGDVNFARRTRRLLARPATAFRPITGVLRSADFTAVNLEPASTGPA